LRYTFLHDYNEYMKTTHTLIVTTVISAMLANTALAQGPTKTTTSPPSRTGILNKPTGGLDACAILEAMQAATLKTGRKLTTPTGVKTTADIDAEIRRDCQPSSDERPIS
jgi:hypothetical protein